jgi:hypothetical protein
MNPDGSGAAVVSQSLLSATPSSDQSASWAPDGSGLVFISDRDGNSTGGLFAGSFAAGQQVIDNPVQISYGASNPAWSGYLPRTPKKLVGSGGMMASAAAGFIFAQASRTNASFQQTRTAVSSVVTFDTSLTTNRVNAQVSKLSDFGGSNAVLSITDGDGTLNNLRYINYVDGKVIQAVGTTAVPTAAGILVSFDGTDGSVATVVPYNATKAAGKIQPSHEGNALVFRGSFPGVWNGTGENVAPSGAQVVRIDAKTGHLIEAE